MECSIGCDSPVNERERCYLLCFYIRKQEIAQNREAEKEAFFFVSEKVNFGLSELHRTHDRPAMQTDQRTKLCGAAFKCRSLRIKQQSPKVTSTGSAG